MKKIFHFLAPETLKPWYNYLVSKGQRKALIMAKEFDDMTAEEQDAWADAIMADILAELGL